MKSIGYHVREASETEMILGSLCTEFDLMKDSLEKSFLDTILGHFLKCVIYCLLAFLDIFKLYPLHAHSECRFFCCVIIPSAGAEVGSDTRLNDFLIEWRVRPVKQQSR